MPLPLRRDPGRRPGSHRPPAGRGRIFGLITFSSRDTPARSASACARRLPHAGHPSRCPRRASGPHSGRASGGASSCPNGLAKLLRNLLYEAGTMDTAVFCGSVAVLLATALACWLPVRARRGSTLSTPSARNDPRVARSRRAERSTAPPIPIRSPFLLTARCSLPLRCQIVVSPMSFVSCPWCFEPLWIKISRHCLSSPLHDEPWSKPMTDRLQSQATRWRSRPMDER